MSKKLLKAGTKFARTLVATKGEDKYTIISQPYVSSMYVAVYHGGCPMPEQFGVNYGKHAAFIKDAKKNFEADGFAVEVQEAKLGAYLKESDIKIINS